MRVLLLTSCLLVAPAALAQTPTSSFSFVTLNRGGMTVESTGGTSAPLQTGYGRVQPSASTAPAGVAIIGFRSNEAIVSEAGFPAVLPAISGRTFAEVDGPVNTGIAFTNPDSLPVVISFHLTNQSGIDFNQRSFTLGGHAQMAAFLNEAPFNVPGIVVGTFTFTATAPVAFAALRGLTNTRNEFLITNQAVVPLPDIVTGETLVMPHFADGGGWQTQVVLVNPGDETLMGTVQFFGQGSASAPAGPIALNVDGLFASSFNYTARPRSSVRLRTRGTSAALQIGSVRVTPAGGARSPSGSLLLSFASNGITVTEAASQASRPSIAWRMFVESSEEVGAPASIQSGIAVTNTSLTNATVSAELTTTAGISAGPTVFFNIPGNGHAARFLHELFPALERPFEGILRITSGATPVSVAALRARYNQRGDFLITTTAPSNETRQTSSADLFFPHIADGGGYTTQFLLFSGVANQNTAGTLTFVQRTGSPMTVILK